MPALIIVIVLIVAAWDIGKTAVKAQAADFQAQRPPKKPGKSAKGSGKGAKAVGGKRPTRARHAAGYWTGELAHGFPVFRNGWWAGWLAHKTARNHQQSIREQARTTHLQGLAEHLRVIREQRDLQRQANEEIQRTIGDAPQPPKGRKEVREAVAKVLPFPVRDPDADPPLPSDGVGKPQPGPYAPRPDAKRDDSSWLERYEERCEGCGGTGANADGSDACPVCRGWGSKPPDPDAPPWWHGTTCRACGRPGTDDDPVVSASQIHRSHVAEAQAQYQEALARQQGEHPGPREEDLSWNRDPFPEPEPDNWPKGVPHRRNGDAPSPATNGGNMPTGTGSDTTYTSVLADAKAAHAQADEDTATIQKRMDDAYAQADQMAAANVDPAVIDEQMSYADSLKAAHQALSQAGEHAGSTAAQAERYHGGMQEAVDNAPGKVAERQFHEGG